MPKRPVACGVDHVIKWWDQWRSTLARGQQVYGGAFHLSTAQGGSWSTRTAAGCIDGYAFGNPDARPARFVPVETIDAGNVGCPALSPVADADNAVANR